MLSGAAGLIYEVVWARQLVLVFGNTTQAISAILTGFFGGMAIGSGFGGRVADRVRRPLRLYGLLEVALVVVVLVTPISFRLIHEVYRAAYGTLEMQPVALSLVRFALALLALGPATILMGATLPALTRYLARGATGLSSAFSRLYAANTVGAILGAAVAGFVLIELFGLSGALLVGAACSAMSGILALWVDRSAVSAPAENLPGELAHERHDSSRKPEGSATNGKSTLRVALAVAFVSGFTSLAYQVLWTRLIASGTGNSTYVFALILTLFLTGLALGALTYTTLLRRRTAVIELLAATQLSIAILAILGAYALLKSRSVNGLGLATSISPLFGSFLVTTVVVVLPATFIMGLSFPAASQLLGGRDSDVGARSGLLVAANTLGAIVGTFIVPFVVIPAVGSAVAVGLVAMTNALTGIALALGGRIVSRTARFAVTTVGAVIAIGLAIALVDGSFFVDPSVAGIRRSGATLYRSAEDEIASVQAGSVNGRKQLWVTGTVMTVLTVDTKLMPILPLILRPSSTTNLTVAFGMGTAYRTALVAGLHTDAVDLVPSVPRMFDAFYPDAAAVLANRNGRVIIADGRNHVELTRRRYDIIVVDPPPPVESAGVSVISSKGFYAAAKARLTPGGVMMQWVPHGQTLDEFKAHVRTFRNVYPNVIVAEGPMRYGFYMLGSDRPIAFSEASVRTVLSRPGILDDISSAPDSPELSLDGWVARITGLVRWSGDEVAIFAGPGPLVTDDRPLPEYFLLRHQLGRHSLRLRRYMIRYHPETRPPQEKARSPDR